ncbi:hypothetical protein B0T26DRAFT_6106 [Lasiosphaeria miniovina]|uniref:Uncharacterized protein n=1 Tax=Lasiosphaeria miniovina TaxID=1954250 RepID=A0AA40BF68_9PEZI|nr:uncharacterized protein B0T26DRAFT_6106 [Lasiosphaeria miniovina]KAK0733123.1 hypothetical protein B0T26DRAFT_6106 [Lasiosphaeria miniovina]
MPTALRAPENRSKKRHFSGWMRSSGRTYATRSSIVFQIRAANAWHSHVSQPTNHDRGLGGRRSRHTMDKAMTQSLVRAVTCLLDAWAIEVASRPTHARIDTNRRDSLTRRHGRCCGSTAAVGVAVVVLAGMVEELIVDVTVDPAPREEEELCDGD